MHFLLRSYLHLWNRYEKTDFLMPHSTYSKKKSFHLLEGTMNVFESWKRSKMEETIFYKQILDFHCPAKILCHTSNLWNFVKITGPYCTGSGPAILAPQCRYEAIRVWSSTTFIVNEAVVNGKLAVKTQRVKTKY